MTSERGEPRRPGPSPHASGRQILEEHRIVEVRTLSVRCRYPRRIGRNSRLLDHGNGSTTQVRVILTDRGAAGWGISWTGPEETSDLVGRTVGSLFDPAEGVVVPSAMPLDFPLHDLAGVILNQPVHGMLGGGGPKEVPCYDGGIYMDDLEPEENPAGLGVVLDNCRHDHDMGYRAFKLKIGRGLEWMPPEDGVQRDIDLTRAVRDLYPDCDVLVDANDGYTCEGFLRYMDAVADCNLFWIEEPFPENRDDLLRLREFLSRRSPRTLVVDGETRTGSPSGGSYGGFSAKQIDLLLSLARERLLDVLIMDIASLGFTNWRRLLPVVVAAGAKAAPHTWGEPLKTLYTAQLAAGRGDVIVVEGIPAFPLDHDWSAYRLRDGLLRVPEAPGFGVRLLL